MPDSVKPLFSNSFSASLGKDAVIIEFRFRTLQDKEDNNIPLSTIVMTHHDAKIFCQFCASLIEKLGDDKSGSRF